MRLSSSDQAKIKSTFLRFRSESVHLYLFGSRTDDAKKGGDIDLLVVFKDSVPSLHFKKLDFVVALKRELGERRIDVTLATEDELKSDEFLQVAMATAIEL